jgi:hypothetical protein
LTEEAVYGRFTERHGLGRHVFHGRKGELYQAYHAGMEDQLGALGLVLNCITFAIVSTLCRCAPSSRRFARTSVCGVSPQAAARSRATEPGVRASRAGTTSTLAGATCCTRAGVFLR